MYLHRERRPFGRRSLITSKYLLFTYIQSAASRLNSWCPTHHFLPVSFHSARRHLFTTTTAVFLHAANVISLIIYLPPRLPSPLGSSPLGRLLTWPPGLTAEPAWGDSFAGRYPGAINQDPNLVKTLNLRFFCHRIQPKCRQCLPFPHDEVGLGAGVGSSTSTSTS
jgi:hypothetical protein